MALACAVLPSVAGAADYCVYPNQSCGPNNLTDLQDALDQAAGSSDADRILLGAHTYVAPGAGGFTYTGPSPVEIAGSGRGQTTLTGQPAGQKGLLYLMANGSSVHDLTIAIPKSVAAGAFGLETSGKARRIEIVEDPTQSETRTGAAVVGGGLLEASSVMLQDDTRAYGVVLGDSNSLVGPSTVRGSVVRAGTGVGAWDAGVIEQSRVSGSERAVVAAGPYISLRNSLLTLNASSGTVVRIESRASSDTEVTADGLTVFAPQTLDTGGILVTTAPEPIHSAKLDLRNSIIRGATPLAAVAGGSGKATIAASYSDYDPNAIMWFGPGADIWASYGSNVGDAAALSEETGHHFSLLPGSPLIDAGSPGTSDGLDVDGNPRVADGNGDGIARRDIGAFELQPAQAGPPPGGGSSSGDPAADTQAPVISGFRSTRSVFAVARAATPRAARTARGTTLRYTLSESARVVVKIQRKGRTRYRSVGALDRSGIKGANRIRFTGRIGRRALRAGRYRAIIRATDAAGNRSAPGTARFRVVR